MKPEKVESMAANESDSPDDTGERGKVGLSFFSELVKIQTVYSSKYIVRILNTAD